jgi:glycosyltransferase involved in cell wall biosynthesis
MSKWDRPPGLSLPNPPPNPPDRPGGPPHRIGVNALYLIPGGVGGTEIYLRALLAALAEIDNANQYFIFTNRETGADLVPAAPNFIHTPQPVRAMSRAARILWEQTALPLAAARLPLFCPCPQVTVFHDLQHKRHPEYFRWLDRPFWRFFLYWAARRSQALIAISGATAADLRRFYPRTPPSKIHIVPHGVSAVFAEIRTRRNPQPFLLAVSTLHPHKNLDGLLRAFALFRRRSPDMRLVVCGMHGFVTGPLHDLRRSLSLQDAVEFPGWIPRAQLYDLYARAWAFIYPSRFEGFGLPILEALAAGIPMACSDVEPMSGVAGDAAVKFDPDNVDAIAAAMLRITKDEALRTRLAEAGPRQAAKFSWKATAEGTLETLRSVLEAA